MIQITVYQTYENPCDECIKQMKHSIKKTNLTCALDFGSKSEY